MATQNEIFLLARIEALEKRVKELENAADMQAVRISNIDINDPVFMQPIRNKYYAGN